MALTLSDAFCVDRYRDEFLGLMRDGSLDILFANIHELQSLYGPPIRQAALAALRDENGLLGVVTRSAEGALVVTRGETRAVPAFPVERVVDTTGAGDLFAAGLPRRPHPRTSTSPTAPASAASRRPRSSAISAPGPQANLRDLARQEGLLG